MQPTRPAGYQPYGMDPAALLPAFSGIMHAGAAQGDGKAHLDEWSIVLSGPGRGRQTGSARISFVPPIIRLRDNCRNYVTGGRAENL
jgi:hypothetical protein